MTYLGKYKWWLGAALLLIILIGLVEPSEKSLTNIRMGQAQSNAQLQAIGRLILEYRDKHGGNSPKRLSDLSLNVETESKTTSNRSTDGYVSDLSGSYDLAPQPNPGFLVRERPGLWSDGSVAVCFDNLSVKRLTLAEFNALANK